MGASVAVQQLERDEVSGSLLQFSGTEGEKFLETLLAVEGDAAPVGGDREAEVEQLGGPTHTRQQSAGQSPTGDPGKGSFDGAQAVWPQQWSQQR